MRVAGSHPKRVQILFNKTDFSSDFSFKIQQSSTLNFDVQSFAIRFKRTPAPLLGGASFIGIIYLDSAAYRAFTKL
jgi:hypothetical protein